MQCLSAVILVREDCAVMNVLLLIGCAVLSAAAAVADEVPPQVSVKDFGAVGDGATDDTAAFQRALDSLAEKGGTVFVPQGTYLIKTHIRVPNSVTLEGVWKIPTCWRAGSGSVLLAVEGEGSEQGPAFITLGINSTVKGLTVFYPNQKPDAIKPYPWCVACTAGENCSIVDCLLVNPYNAVDFGSNPSGRHYIRNLYGQPLRRGIFVDKCYDIGRIENVHFWPFWTWDEKSGIREWLTQNGEAFIFARTDWEYVFNTFCFGYGIGYRFIASENGAANGNFLGIGADAANIAVLVEQTQPPGVLITNGEFVSFLGKEPTEVVVKETHTGVVQFSNCSFWGPAHQIARIDGTGTINFNACNFCHWDHQSKGVPAIEAFGGNVLVNGCNFMAAGKQMALRGKTQSAVVTANRMAGELSVVNPAKADLQIGLNSYKKPPQRPKEERGAIVVDDSDGEPAVVCQGPWPAAPNVHQPGIGYYLGTRWAHKGTGDARATFTPNVPKAGRYAVYAWFGPDPMKDHASNAPVTIKSADGERTVRVDLTKRKGEWVNLGTFRFDKGRKGSITFSNDANGNVLADAVKLVPL